MKHFLFILLTLTACVSKSVETQETTADSVATVTDSMAIVSESVATDATPVKVDDSLPDSLKNNPFAAYHGEYRLMSSSQAEQARMTISFEGNNTFSYYIDYGVADFCSDEARGTFTVDSSNTGRDPAEASAGENGNPMQLVFTLAGAGMIKVSDSIHEFGVGVCNFSGDFLRCDGPCPEIRSEDYGTDEEESDSVR